MVSNNLTILVDSAQHPLVSYFDSFSKENITPAHVGYHGLRYAEFESRDLIAPGSTQDYLEKNLGKYFNDLPDVTAYDSDMIYQSAVKTSGLESSKNNHAPFIAAINYFLGDNT